MIARKDFTQTMSIKGPTGEPLRGPRLYELEPNGAASAIELFIEANWVT